MGPKIREPFVRCDEKPPFFLDGTPKGRILPAAHSLLSYGRDLVVSGFFEPSGNRIWKIFVDLEEHQLPPLLGS
jgi:hypothetical protein